MKNNYCTVLNYKYVPHFLVQIASFEKIIKNKYCFWVLCVDLESYLFLKQCELPDVHILYWREIADPPLQKQRQKHKNSDAHFCWVCKTFFLKYLIQKKRIEKVLYIDSDLFLCSDPGALFDHCLNRYSICLTPHYYNKELTVKQFKNKYGVYNAGFVGVNNKAIEFLSWWQEKTYERCGEYEQLAPAEGRINDQGYLDLVQSLFENVKDLGREYNTGPWNIEDISFENGEPYLGEKKVIFYHFHQLKVENWEVTQYLRSEDNFAIAPLASIYKQYQEGIQLAQQRYVKVKEDELVHLIEEEGVKINNVSAEQHAQLQPHFEELISTVYAMGSHHINNEKYKQAERYFRCISKTVLLIPDRIRGGAYFYLGMCALKDNRTKLAHHYFEECLKRIPDHNKAHALFAPLTSSTI